MNQAAQKSIVIFLGLIGVWVLPAPVSWAKELTTPEKAIRQAFPQVGEIKSEIITFSAEQIAQIESEAQLTFAGTHQAHLISYTIQDAQGLLGYAFEDTVKGKWGPIHYLAVLDREGKVLQVTILSYNEIRGRPIAKNRFLKQYKGKTTRDRVSLGSDIDGVTGATISSRSLTEGIKKILHIFPLLQKSIYNSSL